MANDRDIADILTSISPRAQEVMREIALAYVERGEPVGSRTLSKLGHLEASPATIRNVMSDLEDLGLLYSPHTSAGRLPTEIGLRLFVEGLMQVGTVSRQDRERIEQQCAERGGRASDVIESASTALSGLSGFAGLVASPKTNAPLKQIQFTLLSDEQALAILVLADGTVENRLLRLPRGMPTSALVTAGNYLTQRLGGLTLAEAHAKIQRDMEQDRAALDGHIQKLVELGIATPSADGHDAGVLIVKGQLNLLDSVEAVADLASVRALMRSLESSQTYLKLMEAADQADGVRIFIGSETELFGLSDCSVVIKPYRNADQQIIGAVGVIGPLRLNYGRIIPMVDYTADVMGRLLS